MKGMFIFKFLEDILLLIININLYLLKNSINS